MKPSVYTSWVLIGDAARARIFAVRGKDSPWAEVQDLLNPEGRARVHDILADRPGRVQQGSADGSRSAMEAHTDRTEVEAEHFAKQLGLLLDRGAEEHAYTRLMLVAPPHFLGVLRRHLSERVSRCITYTLDNDYTRLPEHELRGRLGNLV